MGKKARGFVWIILGIVFFLFIIYILSFKLSGEPTGFVSAVFCKEETQHKTETIIKYKTQTVQEIIEVEEKNCNQKSGCECTMKSGLFKLGSCKKCLCTSTKSEKQIPYEEEVQVPFKVKKCLWD